MWHQCKKYQYVFENCIYDIKSTSPRGQSMSCCLWAFCPLSEVPGRSCMVDDIEGILPKGPYLPCVSMAGRALLAGYHRYCWSYIALCCGTDSTYLCEPGLYWFQLMIQTNTVNSHEPHIISNSTVFNILFRPTAKKTSKLFITVTLCGKSISDPWIPLTMHQ